jgi:transposase
VVVAIDVVVARSAGLDIAKASLVACVRVSDGAGGWRTHKRRWPTTTAGLLGLADWLAEHQVSRVGMESTSSYWKPVYYLLEQRFECWLLNARHLRAVPGRKTDVTDAEWICDLVAHGLVRPSFVPPPAIRRLRDLTRRRATLTAERTREKQRMEKLLEDAGIKLSAVVSDLFGVSARDMIEALIRGERDPAVLAELAYGRMRRKRADLAEALVGRFTDHHAFLAGTILRSIDHLSALIGELDVRIDAEMAPFRAEQQLLTSIDGVDARTAEVIIAEIGADMRHFASSAQLASWAGICPGNNKTAGKAKPGHVRPGDRWLKAGLGRAALGAIRTRNTYLAARYRRICARRGGKRAVTAVAHSILDAAWYVLTNRTRYQDLGGEYFLRREDPDRRRRRAVAQLELLGYEVNLQPRAA